MSKWCRVIEITEDEFFSIPQSRRAYPGDEAEGSSWYFGDLPVPTPAGAEEHMRVGIPSKKQLRAFSKARDTSRHIVKAGIARKIPNMNRKMLLRDEGESVDVDAYLRRDLECWQSSTKPPTIKRTVSIAVELGVNSYADEDYFVNLVCSTGAYVEALEKKGFVVTLLGMYSTEFSENVAGMLFPIKRAGRRLNYKKFITYGCKATCRVFGFRHMWDKFIQRNVSDPLFPPELNPNNGTSYVDVPHQGRDFTPWPEMYEAFDVDIIVHPSVRPKRDDEGLFVDPYEMGVSTRFAQTVNTLTEGVLKNVTT